MKFTQIPVDTFQNIQLNAGILVDAFNPSTGVIGNIIGASSGGIKFDDDQSFIDFGDDIDNCPKNMKELKKLDSHSVKLSGTFITVTAASAKMLMAAADVDELNANHIIPRNDLKDSDFGEVWWIGDYSDENGAQNGGFCAIRLMNSLSTGGFHIQSANKGKGQFSFTFEGHYSMDAQETVPYEVYVKAGTAEPGGYRLTVTSVAGTTTGKTSVTVSTSAGSGESYVYQTGVNLAVPSAGAALVGSAWSSWNGSAEISSTTGLEIVVAIIDADNKAVHAGKTIVTVNETS